MPDFLPGPDKNLIDFMNVFYPYFSSNAVALGFTAADAAALNAQKIAFETTYTQNLSAQQAAQAARQAKDIARDALEATVRMLARRMQANPAVTDVQRAAMGITVKDKTPTAAAGAAAATNGASRPVGIVDTSQKLRHEIRFFDENTPTSRKKPEGAVGCEIWVKIVEAGRTDGVPKDISECQYLATDTATPYVAEYEGMHAGKMAHYILRWIYKGGEKGPISEVVSATIVG
jgi:hypothetical protein